MTRVAVLRTFVLVGWLQTINILLRFIDTMSFLKLLVGQEEQFIVGR